MNVGRVLLHTYQQRRTRRAAEEAIAAASTAEAVATDQRPMMEASCCLQILRYRIPCPALPLPNPNRPKFKKKEKRQFLSGAVGR